MSLICKMPIENGKSLSMMMRLRGLNKEFKIEISLTGITLRVEERGERKSPKTVNEEYM